MLRATVCVVLLAVPGLARAQRPDAGPKGPAPRVMVARVGAGGQPVIVRRVTEVVPKRELVPVMIGGRVENREVTVYREVLREIEVRLDVEGVQVFEVNGRRIDPADVAGRLKKATAVLVSADGKQLDPFYLRLGRPDTLVVVAPALVGPQPKGPKDMPREKAPPGR
jgi:hypothetical protein